MYRVFVEGLEFYGYHGVPAEEQKVGHRYRASLHLDVEGSAHLSDRVEDTVDYAKVAALAVATSEHRQYATLERLAQAIGEAILATFAAVETVEITLEKRLPPAPVIADSAGVSMSLTRDHG